MDRDRLQPHALEQATKVLFCPFLAAHDHTGDIEGGRVGLVFGHDLREEHVGNEDARVRCHGRDDLLECFGAQVVAVVVEDAAEVIRFCTYNNTLSKSGTHVRNNISSENNTSRRTL